MREATSSAGIDKDESNRVTYQSNNKNPTLGEREPKFLALDMFPSGPDYPGGQQQEVWSELRKLIPRYRDVARGVPLLFVICAPCQSFTRFIQRRMTPTRTESRERDLNLLSQTIGFIKEFQPEMVISENVASIKTGRYRHIWSEFGQALRKLGYAVGEDRVCASLFGVPQYRRRSVLLAIRNEPGCELALDLQVPKDDPTAPRISVREAIDRFPALEAGGRANNVTNHVCRNLSKVNRQRLMSVKPGDANWGFADSAFRRHFLGLPQPTRRQW